MLAEIAKYINRMMKLVNEKMKERLMKDEAAKLIIKGKKISQKRGRITKKDKIAKQCD